MDTTSVLLYITCKQLIHQNPKRPIISAYVMSLVQDYFWSNVFWRSTKCPSFSSCHQSLCKPEIWKNVIFEFVNTQLLKTYVILNSLPTQIKIVHWNAYLQPSHILLHPTTNSLALNLCKLCLDYVGNCKLQLRKLYKI